MAVAGTVAPIFRGEYDSTAIYDFYHVVNHNNIMWICKVDGTTGIEPSEDNADYWYLAINGADAASLGGETAGVWQTKIDSIQTTSSDTLSEAGWYRVAQMADRYPSAVIVSASNRYNMGGCDNIVLYAEGSYHNETIHVISSSVTNTHLFTKARIVYDESYSYFEIYYNYANPNPCFFNISNISRSTTSFLWQAITPTLTAEEVDGVTVITTYDIPANASPMTDLDLDLRTLPQIVASGTDVNTLIDSGVYFLDGGMSNYPNAPNCSPNVMIKVDAVRGRASDNERITQIAISLNGYKMYYRTSLGAINYWTEWEGITTTSDLATELAKYLPKAGGTLTNNLTITSTEALVRGLIFSNSLRNVQLVVDSAGRIHFKDVTNNKEIILSEADGTSTFYGTATGNLALDGGGTVKAPSNSNVALRVQGFGTINRALIGYLRVDGGLLGYLGMDESNIPIMLCNDGVTRKILLHEDNFSEYALPISGGNMTYADFNYNGDTSVDYTLRIYESARGVFRMRNGDSVGNGIDFDTNNLGGIKKVLHTGNSSAVVVSSSAPSDTSALWYDTVNKVLKRYVDGAWQQ